MATVPALLATVEFIQDKFRGRSYVSIKLEPRRYDSIVIANVYVSPEVVRRPSVYEAQIWRDGEVFAASTFNGVVTVPPGAPPATIHTHGSTGGTFSLEKGKSATVVIAIIDKQGSATDPTEPSALHGFSVARIAADIIPLHVE